MNTTSTAARTRVALLGTIGHLHAESVRYDLTSLQSAVETLEPDFLGVELEPGAWEQGDLSKAPLEVGKALVPAARRTDTVILPLGGSPSHAVVDSPHSELAALRTGLLRLTDAALARMQRSVEGPVELDEPFFRNACHLICHVEQAAAGRAWRRQWEAANRDILARLLAAVRRDPGRLFLVAVQCRRLPWLRSRLRAMTDEIALVEYRHLHDSVVEPTGGVS